MIEERPNKLIKLLFGAIETYFEEAFRHRADLLTVISTALGERAHGLGIPREKIVHLPGGADVDFWVPLPQAQARAEVGIPAQALVVGYMGFVHYDIELILRSFAVVRRSVDAKLLLTGKRNPLTRQLGEELGVLDHILDMGTVPYEDVPKYVASADVCLLPFANKIANIGRWPNKLGDYLAMGRPVVSNPVGDVQALLASERCGLMARDEPEDFAAKVVTLLEDSTLREEMAANARRVAAEKISYDRLALRLEECYYRALETMREGAGSTAGLSARQQR